MTQELFGFDVLIQEFLEKKITTEAFEKRYLKKYLEDEDPISDDQFFILDELFVFANGYTEDVELLNGDSNFYFNEAQLREAAQKALQELRALK